MRIQPPIVHPIPIKMPIEVVMVNQERTMELDQPIIPNMFKSQTYSLQPIDYTDIRISLNNRFCIQNTPQLLIADIRNE